MWSLIVWMLAAATLVLPLPRDAAAATAVYRVNAGGPQLPGTPPWSGDTAAHPSPYLNTASTGTKTFSTATTIDMSDPSIPAGTPSALFQTERWDPAGGAEMQWKFPVTAGSYLVRLAFAEIFTGAQGVGARTFDVSIEGTVVLDNYDIFADVGGFKGVVKSFVVSSDGTLDLAFGHVVENPAIKGIEILPAAGPNQLAASPSSLGFGAVKVGETQSKSIQLANLGGSGDPSIIVDSTSITGTDGVQFGDSFNDAGNLTVPPGASTTIAVSFNPASAGAKSATLSVQHSGGNSPLTVPLTGSGSALPGAWQQLATSGPARQEVSYVQVGGKFYLAGGSTAHEVYNPATNTWSNLAPLPKKLDHIQGVTVGGLIYYVGGLETWPAPSVNTVYIYNPATNTFTQGAPMPRPRGAGGVAVFGGKIYYAGGLNNSGAVPWFDVYDPAANTWTPLPDMPTARDHFHAAVVNAKLYAIGGRATQINATTTVNQAFDFATGKWTTGLAPLPTPRGGFAAAALGDEVLVIGGEGGGKTFGNVEAYNTVTNTWRTLASMPTPRHGIQAAVCNGGVYVAAGGQNQGETGPTDVHQLFFLNGAQPCTSAQPVGFGKSKLTGASSSRVTSLQFGPDGRLYVAQQDGLISIYTVKRNGPNSYAVTQTQKVTAIQSIPNHNDNGSVNTAQQVRQVTGIVVTGTAANPVIYAGSSDPRIGGGSSGADTNLDTNSSMISRLTWNGSSWQKVDLVRGLPRSEENHSVNGLQLDPATNTLYAAIGGNTNKGAPSNNFALLPEFALSSAILKINLATIGNATYDLPTLDDESRAGSADAGDPLGGNNGKNQAKIVANGPVQVHASGFRNPYDLLVTKSGRMYTIDNGSNAGWGDIPQSEGPGGTCTNQANEPGTTDTDGLHFVTGAGYFGGHPNPTRGNKANTFNSNNPQSPVPTANPVECDYRKPGAGNGALTTFSPSTNGLAEYTASNFGGVLNGDLLAAAYDNKIYRMKLNASGTAVTLKEALFSTVDAIPLDVTAQGDNGPFPGTIWTGDVVTGSITVFEPNDFGGGTPSCTGADQPSLDEDSDGYANADELDNSTDPCSAGDVPPDYDGDFVSNLNDTDDDNDGKSDTTDPFAVDPANGTTTGLPVSYTWDNNAPNPGGLLELGFTGLMSNGSSNYESLFNPSDMTAGGAAGVTTVDKVADGDALGATNTQKYGFQFGVKPPPNGAFTAHTRIVGPFTGLTPQNSQSMGLFIGNGDQDNYVKVVTFANSGAGGIQALKEVSGVASPPSSTSLSLPGPDAVELYLTVDPAAATVQPSYAVTSNGVKGSPSDVGAPVAIPAAWLNGSSGLAVGIISTSAGPAPEFPATWDLIEVLPQGGTTSTTATDAFSRTVGAGGWGSADVGGAWSVVGGAAANFAVNGSAGTITAPKANKPQLAHLAAVAIRDLDATLDTSFPSAVSGSGGFFSYLVARQQGGGAHHRVGLHVTAAGKLLIRGQTNTGANLFADVDTGLAFTAGSSFTLRVQVEGASPTTIRAKAWKTGTAEPAAWKVTATDTSGPQLPGTLGIRAVNTSPAATTLSYDNLHANRLS